VATSCARFHVNGPWAPLGAALAAFHDRGEDVAVTVRNDFAPPEEIYASVFFRREDAFEEWEAIALGRCGRRVLDIGAGVGAHALVLQERGHKVTALDPIPEAIRIMRERGVDDAREGTLLEFPSPKVYNTVILLMNGSMIAETLTGLDRLLAAAATVLEPQGGRSSSTPLTCVTPRRARTRTTVATSVSYTTSFQSENTWAMSFHSCS